MLREEKEVGGFRELPAHREPIAAHPEESVPSLCAQARDGTRWVPSQCLEPQQERGRSPSPENTPLGVQSPSIYLKMLHQLPGFDLDDNVVLRKYSLQHLLVGQPEHDLAPGTNDEADSELLHRSPRGPGHATRGNKTDKW